MVSEFRKKKLNFIFDTFFDVNKDGSIERDDFELAVEKIAKLRGFTKGDSNYNDLSDRFIQIWVKLQQTADSDGDNEVSRDEWVKLWETSVNEEWKILYMEFMFRLQDTSEDGVIEVDEFSQVCVAFGVPPEDCKQAFDKLSKNGTATVNFTYYSEMWKEYFTSDDENAPGNCIFGHTF